MSLPRQTRPRRYRVWTRNCDETLSVMTEWTTYTQCKRMVVGRWQHWPAFAFISMAKTSDAFRRANGV